MNEQINVSKLTPGMSFAGDLLVRSIEKRVGKTGRAYLDLMLGDKTGDINGKIWDPDSVPGTPVAGGAVTVEGTVESFNGRNQMRINRIRPASNPDLRLLIPASPEPAPVMLAQIDAVTDSFRSGSLRALVREMLNMTGESLSYYPAAQRMHHAEHGGLLHHMTSMLRMGEKLCEVYEYLDRDLLMAGIILHDLAKTVELKSDRFGNVSDYTADGILVGHLVRGAVMLQQAAEKVGADEEMTLLLQHMMLSHHGVPEYGSPRLPMTPEAEALHWIDTLDAKMNEMQAIQERTPVGVFSERIAYLDDRRMYHPNWRGDLQVPEDPQEPAAEETPSAPDASENGLLPY
ncbi:MAG: HD domain-containing protein [Clostridia bacterium]|nr:HD domain-containing protein [Clostridia bacterium]